MGILYCYAFVSRGAASDWFIQRIKEETGLSTDKQPRENTMGNPEQKIPLVREGILPSRSALVVSGLVWGVDDGGASLRLRSMPQKYSR